MLKFESCRLARKHNTHLTVSEVKVSYEWVTHFMVRHDLKIRHRTLIAQRLLEM
jgi:hypothetical protein